MMMEPIEDDECNIGSPLSPIEAQIMNFTQTIFDEVQEVKPTPMWKKIITSSTIHAMAFIVFFIITIPTLIFLFVVENDPPRRLGISSCSVDPGYRVSCGHTNIPRSYCLSIRCCHDEEREECYHFIPSKYGYSAQMKQEVTPGYESTSGRFLATPQYTTLGTVSVPELMMTVQEIDAKRVKVILHQPEDNIEGNTISEPKEYSVGLYHDLLAVEIHRSEAPHDLLLTSVLGPLMASEQYWEWTFQMTNTYLFGMGGLLIEPNATVNQTFYPNRYNHILQQPMFLAHTHGQWHSLLVDWVGGPLEVTVLPSRLVVLRMIGGSRIELTLGVGPDPRSAANQMRFTGKEMMVPPRWMLGLHMCRDGVTTLQEAIREYVQFYLKERILRFETDCIHENLFLLLANDDPNGNTLKQFENSLQRRVINNILLSIPPQIPVGSTIFDEATTLGILYKNGIDSEYVNASYNGLDVAYPNYDSESISDYMPNVQNIINAINRKGPIVGFVLRDNWPDADNIFFNDEKEFPYTTEKLIRALSYTLPYSATTNSTSPSPHYLSHRSYSISHLSAIQTLQLPTAKQPVYITPTPAHGSSDPAQAHNLYAHLQHVNATWDELRRVLHYSVYHSMFKIGGTGLVMAPVCGSGELWNAELQEELCIRWWLYAATTALVRVSSAGLRRDPESLASKTSQSFVFRALRHRTALLPYYYTTLAQREPLLRPMFYDYPMDENTYTLDEQYMVGDALLVAQPLSANKVIQRVYLPRRGECGGWYEYWEGKLYDIEDKKKGRKRAEEDNEGLWVELPVVSSDWIMFIASGKIIPRAKDSSTDTFNLLLATGKETCPVIKGEMVFTEQTLLFEADQHKLSISNILAVQREICGGIDDAPSSFHNIEHLYIYSRVTGNIQTSNVFTDLCKDAIPDTIEININNGPMVP